MTELIDEGKISQDDFDIDILFYIFHCDISDLVIYLVMI